MKKWLRTAVALLALVAMLAENTVSVYASMDGVGTPEETVQEAVSEPEEVLAETSVSEESAPEDEEIVADDMEIPEEAASEENTDYLEDTGEEDAGVVSASIEALSDRIRVESVDDFTVYINTDEMKDGDHFKLGFTDSAIPFMEDALYGTMEKGNGGIYNIAGLDKGLFELWVDTISPGMEVAYALREDGYPQITLKSEPEPEVKKSLEADGQVVYGEGYTELHITVDPAELPDDTYYALHIDTEADVKYDGRTLSDNVIETLSNHIEDIYLSNLDKAEFELYITGENDAAVGAEYFVESVENGALRMSLNMDGSLNPEEAGKVTELKATIVDQFGDEISDDYKDMELPEFTEDVLALDDAEKAPVEDVEVENGTDRLIKYTYVESRIDKKVIKALKRKEMADENGENGYAYFYTEDGEKWKAIREDATVYFEYSDGKKSVYEYEDDQVSVTATLQHANAIPDDAEFIVTPITAESEGYNYDVYMQALNENAEEILGYESDEDAPAIDESNVLLYDIGFFITDEDGNRKELQPADGSVKISLNFKKNQLEDELGLTDDNEVTVVHLPLTDAVKENVDTTEEATDITTADVKVEVVDNASGKESLDFTLSEFSPVAALVNGKMAPGTRETFETVLGDAVLYGIVGNEVTVAGDLESTMAVGTLHGNAQIKSGRNSGGAAGVSYIGDYDGSDLLYERNGENNKDSMLLIYTTQAVWNRMGFDMNGNNGGNAEGHGTIVDYTTYDKPYIQNMVSKLVSDAQEKSLELYNRASYNFKKVAQKDANNNFYTLDLSNCPDGTYYITFDKGDFAKYFGSGDRNQDSQVHIKMKETQNIIFNIPDEKVSFTQYQIKIGNSGWTGTHAGADEDLICQSIIFNAPYAKVAATAGQGGASSDGVHLVPNAVFTNGVVSAGWVIADKIAKIGGNEWHNVWNKMPPSTECKFTIYGKKTIDGKTPNTNQKFWFDLYAYGNQPDGMKNNTLVDSVQNNGSSITFKTLTFKKAGTYKYKVVEREVTGGYVYDKTQYIVAIDVTGTKRLTAKLRYIATFDLDRPEGQREQMLINQPSNCDKVEFDNTEKKSIPYDFDVKKLFDQSGYDWPDGATFTFRLTQFDGGNVSANAGTIKYGPLPDKTYVKDTNYCELTLTKDKREDTFGRVYFDMMAYDDGKITSHYFTNADFNLTSNYYTDATPIEVWNRNYMYTIKEVIPDNKVNGVTYEEKTIHLKVLVDSMYHHWTHKYTVKLHDRISLTNEAGSCYDNPGPFDFTNKYTPGELTIKKVAKDWNNKAVDNDKEFYVIVYSQDTNGSRVYYALDGSECLDASMAVQKVKGNNQITYAPMPLDRVLYVYEADANGQPINDSDDYQIVYEGLGKDNSTTLTLRNLKKTVKIKNTKREKGTLKVVKMAGLGDESPFPLAGVKFIIKTTGNDPVYVTGSNGSYTYATREASENTVIETDANGSFEVKDLPVGKYYLKETGLPDAYENGFVAYTENIYFNVTREKTELISAENANVKRDASINGMQLKFTVYNKRVPVAIEIEKNIMSSRPSGTVLHPDVLGYKFFLYDETDNNKKYEIITTVQKDKRGYGYFTDGLKVGHTYRLEEDPVTTAQKGTVLYSPKEPIRFTVDETWYQNAAEPQLIGGAKYILKKQGVFVNEEISGKIKLIKTDAKDVKIPEGNAEFVLSTSIDPTDESKYVFVSKVADGSYRFAVESSLTRMQTVNGELIVDELAPGTYYFFEKKSPDTDKYVYTEGQPYPFTLDAATATADKPVIDLTADDVAIKVKNDSFAARLSFEKVNAFDPEKKLSEQTKFTLYETNGYKGAKVGDAIYENIPATNGVVSVPFAKAGTYVLEETTTEEGYVHLYDDEPLKIYLKVDSGFNGRNDLTLENVEAVVLQKGRTLKADQIIDLISNYVKNEPEFGHVTLKKRFVDKNGNEITSASKIAYLLGEANFTLMTNSKEFKLNDRQYAKRADDTEFFVPFGTWDTINQTLTVNDLPWGDYYFVENATVRYDGKEVYVFADKDENHYRFTVGKGQNGNLLLDINEFVDVNGKTVQMIDNDIKVGSAKIVKRDADTNEGIAGIRFELYRVKKNETTGKYEVIEKISLNPDKTSADGSLTVTGLEFGTYYFIESKNQDINGYEFDTETQYFFNITEQDEIVDDLTYYVKAENATKTSNDGTILNQPVKGKVSLDKWAIAKDTTDDPEYLYKLAGAKFDLYSDKPSHWYQEIRKRIPFFSNDEDVYKYGEYTTGQGGTLEVTDLPWGTYFFIETEAPEGYVMPADEIDRTYEFIIDGDHLDVHIRRPEGTLKNDELRGKVPVNERLNGSLKLIKENEETKAGMAGIPFRLFRRDGVDTDITATLDGIKNNTNKIDYTFKDGHVETLLVTNAEGEITVENLPWGDYYFKEAEIPEGFTAVTTSSALLTINASNASADATYDATNTAKLINTPIKGNLKLHKVDNAKNGLTGATFDLVRVDNGAYHEVKVSGSAGVYAYTGLESSDYRGTSVLQNITDFVKAIFATKKGKLETNDQAILTVANLPYGHYEVYEITPPDGYEPNAENPVIIRSFDIDGTGDDYDAELEFVNTKVYAGVQFVKTLSGTEELKGAKFILQQFDGEQWTDYDATESAENDFYKEDDKDNTVIGHFTSVVTFSGLPVGRYRIYEVSDCEFAPEAVNTYPYLNADEKEIWSKWDENTDFYYFSVTMSDNGVNNVGLDNYDGTLKNAETVDNTPKKGKAMLMKMEGTTAISGAKFALFKGTSKDGKPVLGNPKTDARLDEITSVNGEVWTSDLNWGDYYLVETETSDTRYFLEKEIEDRVQYHFTIAPDANGNFTRVVTDFVAMQDGKDSKSIKKAENTPIKGKAEFAKRDKETNGLIMSDQITFALYYKATADGEYQRLTRYSGENTLNAANGWIRTNKDLEVGYYYFVELTTADGYETLPENIDDRTKFKFEIKQGDTPDDFEITWDGEVAYYEGNRCVYNTPKPGKVELFKYYVLDTAEVPLANASFTLSGTTTAGKSWSKTISSGTDGVVTFENVPWGTYNVQEVKTPAGYKLPDGVTLPTNIVIDAQHLEHDFRSESDETLKILNERKKGKLSLKKEDNKGKAVAGVAFELQKQDKDGNWIKINNPENAETGYYVTGEGGLLSFFNLVTKKGEIEIKELAWGQYRLIEREVPEGYQLMTGYIPDENGVYVGAENMTDESHLEYNLGVIVNQNIHGNIGLRKIDDKGHGLSGAEFELFQGTDSNKKEKQVYVKETAPGVYAYVSMDLAKAQETEGYTKTLVSPGEQQGVTIGKIKVTGLPCGKDKKYYMQETKEPDPVTVDGQTIVYTMQTDMIGPFVVTVDQAPEDKEQSSNSLTWVNGPNDFYAYILFRKLDGAKNGLDGVVYKITNKATNASWTVESQAEGDEHGIVRAKFVAAGDYTIEEVSTPDDAYELDTNVYDFSILTSDNTKTRNLTELIQVPANSKFSASENAFINPPAKGGVKLVKKESESAGEGYNPIGTMNNVTFKLYKIEKDDSRTPVTRGTEDSFVTATVGSESGVIKVSDLEWGSYVFVETVPDDYEGDAAEYTFTIDRDTFKKPEKIEVVMPVNKRKPGSLTVQKFFDDEEKDFNGEGVEFTLKLVAGTSDIVTSYTDVKTTKKDENGNYFVEFNNLPWGIYELTEGEPKEGYFKYIGKRTVKIGHALKSEGKAFDVEGLHVDLVGRNEDETKEDLDKGIINRKIKGSVKLQKVDSVKKAPVVASFKLYKGTHPETIGTTTTGVDPIVMQPYTDEHGIFTTNKDGFFTFPEKSLAYGSYYLEEAVPEGYEGHVENVDPKSDAAFTYRGVHFSITSEETVLLTKDSQLGAIVNTPELGKVKLKKVDEKGDPIKGVIFTLYADDAQGADALALLKSALKNLKTGENGTIYATVATEEDGTIEISGLPWGTYHFVETVPQGYELTAEEKARIEKPFYLGEKDGVVELEYDLCEVTNKKLPGSVKLIKKGQDTEAGTENLLAGAKFNLYRLKGKMDPTPEKPEGNDPADEPVALNLESSYDKDKLGVIEVPDLPWGQYYFYETEAPEGFEKSTDKPEILDVGRIGGKTYTDVTLILSDEDYDKMMHPYTTVTNKKGYGYTALYKKFEQLGEGNVNTAVETTNENGEKTYLTFSIYRVDTEDKLIGDPLELTYGMNKGTQFPVHALDDGKFMTDLLGPLPYGRYAFVESSVPDGVGYEADPEPRYFNIDKNCTKDNVIHEMNAASPSFTQFRFVTEFINTSYRGYAKITKKDITSGEFVEGVKFHLYRINEAEGKLSLGSYYGSYDTNAAGVAMVNGLPLGKYAFLEDAASAEKLGYVPVDSAFVFEITKDSVSKSVAPVLTEATKNDDNTYSLTTNTVDTVDNERQTGSLKLKKTGKDSKPLAGAVFNLYKVAGERDDVPGVANGSDPADEIITVNGTKDHETDAEGLIFVDGLAWGTYYFDEIVPPKGYKLLARPNHEAKTIGKGVQTAEVTMSDPPIRIDITKTEITGKSEIEGAEMAIFEGESKTALITWTSTKTAKRIEIGEEFGGLTATTDPEHPEIYRISETKAPTGYTVTADIYFSVDTAGNVTLYNRTVVDDKPVYTAATLENAVVKTVTDGGAVREVPLVIVKDNTTGVKITKRELGTTRYLPGATLAIYDKANYDLYKAGNGNARYIDSWTTAATDQNEAHEITGKLEASNGTKHVYYLVETGVPAGYFKAAPIAFTVNNDNEIELYESTGDSTGTVTTDKKLLIMYDRPIYVKITKKDKTEDKALAGAKLNVFDGDKKVNETFWTTDQPALLVPVTREEATAASAKEKYELLAKDYQLVYGVKLNTRDTYTLRELEAPEGYKIAADQKFTVDTNKAEYNQTLGIYETEMLDETIKIYISKKALTGQDELKGAKLAIYEKIGEQRGKKIKGWVSGTAPTLISISTVEGDDGLLQRGKEYWLVEEEAPEGYDLSDDMAFTIDEKGNVEVADFIEDENGEKIRLITMKDEPLALIVSKEDDAGRKLKGAKLELRTSAGSQYEVLASWTSDGKIAYIYEHEPYESANFTAIKLNAGKHLRQGVKYYVVETKAPDGYEKAKQPLEVTAMPESMAKDSKNAFVIINTKFGKISKEGVKTWNITPTLAAQLQAQNAKIYIKLYRYYTDDQNVKMYVGQDETVSSPEKTKDNYYRSMSIVPSTSKVQYAFDDLPQFHYKTETGEAKEYTYELEEDLNGLEDVLVSRKIGDSFVNNERYTRIEGDKKWILFKNDDGAVIDLDTDEGLREALKKLSKDDVSAYVNVDIALATLDKDGVATIIDKDGDNKADYYVTIRYGAKNPEEPKQVEYHESEKGHIVINWTKAGEVHFAFEKLPAYDDNNNKIEYAFVENPTKGEDHGKFEVIYGTDGKPYGTNGTLITNKPIYDPFTIRGKKLWKDPYDKSVKERPEVTIQLYRDNKAMEGYRKTLTADDNYTFTFGNLYEYDFDQTQDGHKYKYELKEEGATGDYAISIDFNGQIMTLENGDRVKDVTVTNKIKPEYITIDGVKTWQNADPTKVPEVTFNLYQIGKDAAGKETKTFLKSYTMKNAAGNKYEFKELPKYDDEGQLITYRVEEDLTNLGGYKSEAKPANDTAKANLKDGGYTITPDTTRGLIKYTGNDFENTPSHIRVRKSDMTSSKILPGAKMRVIDKETKKEVDSWTTGSKKEDDKYIEGLTFNRTYILEEVEAPKGYLKIEPIEFKIDENNKLIVDDKNASHFQIDGDLMTVEDPPLEGKVTLTKRDAVTRDTLSGAVFALYTSDGKLVHVTGSTGSYEYTEDTTNGTSLAVSSAGTLSVSKLPCASYYFKETKAPTGYKLSTETMSFTIDPPKKGDTIPEVTITYLNERLTGSVSLHKTSRSGTSLSGAVFELYSATPKTVGQAAASTVFSDAYYRYGTYTTGSDGRIRVSGLPYDDYYFIETKAPSGYKTNRDVNGDPLVYTFKIDSTSTGSIGVDLGTITNDTTGGGGGGDDGETEVYDDYTTGGGGGGGGSSVAGARRSTKVSDVLGVRAKPTSGVLGVRVGPVTGDAANIALWLLLLVASISMIVVICIQNHKKKKRAAAE
ncbi:MAG: Cna B-type domain-containing protein [Lachnospiraceae bacterium]|nr:Cna B-type domain-containing protein [Lachnospiraceae bacterium]